MKARSFAALLFAAFTIVAASCGSTSTLSADRGPIRLGFFADVSSSAADEGNDALRGALLQLKEVNASGGINGRLVELIHYDSKQSPAEAVRAYSRLAQEDGVSAVIGSSLSTACLAVSPVAELVKVPVVSHCLDDRVTTENMKPENPSDTGSVRAFSFLTQPTANAMGFAMASYAKDKLGKSRFATLTDQASPLAVIQAKAFEYYAKSWGAHVVSPEELLRGDTDFSVPLSRIKAAAADCILIAGPESESLAAAEQAAAMGIEARLIGSASWTRPISEVVPGVHGFVACQGVSLDDPGLRPIAERYEKEYGRMPGLASIYGWDDLAVILEAIRRSGSSDPLSIREALEAASRFSVSTGTLSMDAKTHRRSAPSFAILWVENGSTRVLDPRYVPKETK